MTSSLLRRTTTTSLSRCTTTVKNYYNRTTQMKTATLSAVVVSRFFASSSSPPSSSSSPSAASSSSSSQPIVERFKILTLYRSLLRWCDDHYYYDNNDDENIPVDTFVPPFYYKAKTDVEKKAFQELYTCSQQQEQLFLLNILPKNTIIKSNSVTIPISYVIDIKNTLRFMFRINKNNNKTTQEYSNTTVLFETLKTLNELSKIRLKPLQTSREEHSKRNDGEILFIVGQVVQHKDDRWRGIVIEWDRIDNNETTATSNKLTSLTKKNYSLMMKDTPKKEEEEDNNNDTDLCSSSTGNSSSSGNDSDNGSIEIEYKILVDTGDARRLVSSLESNARNKNSNYAGEGLVTCNQTELEPIFDEQLKHIRVSPDIISQYFDKYDSLYGTQCFIPNKLLSYQYPTDANILINNQNENYNTDIKIQHKIQDVNTASNQIINIIQLLSKQLLSNAFLVVEDGEDTGLKRFISSIKKRLISLSNGDVHSPSSITRDDNLFSLDNNAIGDDSSSEGDNNNNNNDATNLAIEHIKVLLTITKQLNDMLYTRYVTKQNRSKIKFKLGDVVKHKKFHYRGIIVGYDPYPVVDISRWDGLINLESPAEKQTFYHVIPDKDDCIKEFGNTRPFMYTVEENLSKVEEDNNTKSLNIDLQDIDEFVWFSDKSSYKPADQLVLKYAEEDYLDDDNKETNNFKSAVSCLETMKDIIDTYYLAARDYDDNNIVQNNNDDDDDSNKMQQLRLQNNLLLMLRDGTSSMEDSLIIENMIEEIWKASGGKNKELQCKLEDAVTRMTVGNANAEQNALGIFNDIIKEDPSYYEAYNKKSMCLYMSTDNMSEEPAKVISVKREAMDIAKIALQLQPNHFQVLNQIGWLYYGQEQYEKAITYFRKSLRINPWSPISSKLALCIDLHNNYIDNVSLTHPISSGDDDDDDDDVDEGSIEGTAPYET